MFLNLGKDAYQIALEVEVSDQKAPAVVQAYDKVYSSSAFHFRPRASDEYKRYMDYVKLRRFELLASYGDDFGQEQQLIRANLKEQPPALALR